MALEDLTGPDKGIDDLVILNPDGLDPRSEGDNHIRGVKNVLVNTFGPMPAAAVSLPAVGDAPVWDGTKYEPGPPVNPQFLTPVGAIIDFAIGEGGTAPAGWLECNGAAVSRTTYAALFAAIGAAWGAGDGSTTFNVPDLRDRATIGRSPGALDPQRPSARTAGQAPGSETHVLTTAEMPSHDHGLLANNLSTPAEQTATGPSAGNAYATAGGTGAAWRTVAAGSGAGHSSMQPSAVVWKIIKT